MKFAWCIVAAVVLLAGCSGVRQSAQVECPKDSSLVRGTNDGKTGRHADLSFLKSCTPESRHVALAAYREGFEASRPKRKVDKNEASVEDEVEVEAATVLAEPTPVENTVREPSALSWVCEVEANSKIFTGVGLTRDEALGSARATCGSHIQASYCSKADCKQSL